MGPPLSPPGLSQAVGPSPKFTHFPAVNTITLGGYTLPGKWTLTEAKAAFGWQIQQAYGLSYAAVIPRGDELIAPKFKGEFWSDYDYSIFRDIWKQLFLQATFYVPGTNNFSNQPQAPSLAFLSGLSSATISTSAYTSKAIGIDHPSLKLMGCNSVVLLGISAPVDEDAGLWSLSLDFLQFRAPVPAKTPPKQTIPDAPKPKPVAQDGFDVEGQQLQAAIAKAQGT
jgi:hypothetical protein